MNFFEHQDRARRNTRLLVALYIAAVVLIVLSVYLSVQLIAYLAIAEGGETINYSRTSFQFWNPDHFLASASITLILILAGTLFRVFSLQGGGKSVAEMLGGKRIPPNTQDADERKVLNIVEEMAIASGTPVPPVYIMDGEAGINAFAAGYSPKDAVVAVTRGSVSLLSRDELQGVIAHEFSHIFNGDMRLNIRLMGVLYGILMISLTGRGLLRSFFYVPRGRSRSNRGGGKAAVAVAAFACLLLVIGYIGVLIGNMIKAAVSRQREYLADASAVQFTRNPAGISGALKKIGGAHFGSIVEASKAAETSHMFFSQAVSSSFDTPFSTHPPLDDRIKRIDPSFDGKYPEVKIDLTKKMHPKYVTGFKKETPTAEAALSQPAYFAKGPGVMISEEKLTSYIGEPTPHHIVYAQAFLEKMPADIRQMAREPWGARAAVYALLLDRKDEDIRKRQWRHINATKDAELCNAVLQIWLFINQNDEKCRLPLLELSLPALALLSPEQIEMFRVDMQNLILEDQQINYLELAVEYITTEYLKKHTGKKVKSPVKYFSVNYIWPYASDLLGALARVSHEQDAERMMVYKKSASLLLPEKAQETDILPDPKAERMRECLHTLAESSPGLKQRFLRAAIIAIEHDGTVNPQEAELFRAFAAAVDCPANPFV